ncbi:MAG TPA: class II glutamine amidotransferase [Cellvibrio sp.]|nr:class II glutamine amidotransferase [Cellvibrio sp.]
MCQLLGMSCKEPASINFSLEGFVARGGLTDEHRDGWGIAFFRDDAFDVFLDHQPASHSALVAEINTAAIKSKTIIAHIRKATVGEVKLANCHPFQRELRGKTWLFCHNGHLKDFNPALNGQYLPQGDTDSELAFCYLLQELELALPEGVTESAALFALLDKLSREIEKFGIFNIIISNGELLFTFCSTALAYVERQYPFTTVTLVDKDVSLDLSQHNTEADKMILIATKPLTKNEDWKVYQQGESRMFREAEILHKQLAK